MCGFGVGCMVFCVSYMFLWGLPVHLPDYNNEQPLSQKSPVTLQRMSFNNA